MSEPSRRRVAVPSEPDAPAERRGCMRVAAILGILVGIPAGLFGIPAAVDLFYGETDVAPGETWRGDGVAISVESVVVDEGPRAVTVTLRVRADEAWTFEPEDVELELADGERIPLDWPGEPPAFGAGADETIALAFPLPDDGAVPRALRLPDPGVRFELRQAEP